MIYMTTAVLWKSWQQYVNQ